MSRISLRSGVCFVFRVSHRSKPLTDEKITALLEADGINVTRRTVAKYREDMKIPSTHQRRQRD